MATGQLGAAQLGSGWLGGAGVGAGGGGGGTVITVGAAIPTGEFWPTPNVSGPIVLSASIPSGEHWPTPSLTRPQTITPGAAIPTGEAWPTPRVANVQTIRPAAAIPSGESWPIPTMTGGPKWVNTAAIPSGEKWYPPMLTGGAGGVFVWLSGVNRTTPYLSRVEGTCTVQSQTLGRWQAGFDLYCSDGSFAPVLGQTCLLTDNGTRIFAGCITQIIVDRLMSTKQDITYHCTALDKSAICDHRVIVGKTYPMVDPISNAPQDVATTILNIVQVYLNGEGIQPGPEIVPGAFGAQSSDYNWNFPTVTQAFDQISSSEGLVWWIDDTSILHFSPLVDLPAAPFGLSETSNNWRNLTATSTTTAYYNKLYAVSNLNVLPGASGTTGQAGYTDTYIFAPDNPGVVTITNSLGTRVAVGLLTSVAIGSIISMTVDGHAQSVINFPDFTGQTRTGPTDYLWFFFSGNNQLSWTFDPGVSTITVEYLPYSSTNASNAQYGTALAPQSPGGQPLGTCGSGVYEGVVQVQSINDVDQLNAIAAAELARIGTVPTVLDFETDYPGLRPGQLLQVDIPLIGVGDGVHPVPMLITTANGTWMSGDTLPFGGNFRWHIQATTNLDPGNWVKWNERLVHKSDNPLPVLQYETATFILGAGSALSGGAQITNPYIVNRTGQLTQLLLAAAIPPTDQDLTLQIKRNGVTIAAIIMPSGTAANALITQNIARSAGLYVFAGEVLTCTAIYGVSGPDPTPASGVTLACRWAI